MLQQFPKKGGKAEPQNLLATLTAQTKTLSLPPQLPHMNNHSAQVGRLLFQIDESSSGET